MTNKKGVVFYNGVSAHLPDGRVIFWEKEESGFTIGTTTEDKYHCVDTYENLSGAIVNTSWSDDVDGQDFWDDVIEQLSSIYLCIHL